MYNLAKLEMTKDTMRRVITVYVVISICKVFAFRGCNFCSIVMRKHKLYFLKCVKLTNVPEHICILLAYKLIFRFYIATAAEKCV